METNNANALSANHFLGENKTEYYLVVSQSEKVESLIKRT